ncbi:MAG: YIP1 family protein [Nanoarchaeota archaeon]|nr:YIP1 family protein [Nanoarchaeota archaeon]
MFGRSHKRDVVETVKGFIFNPKKQFDKERKTKLNDAGCYFLSLLFLMSVLFSIVSSFVLSSFLGSAAAWFWIVALFSTYVSLIIFKIVWGLWLHLWVLLLTKGKKFDQTLKAVFFGGTPFYLFGWIPVIGFLSMIWSLVLDIIGLSRLHKIERSHAAIAAVIAVLIPLLVAVFVFAWILAVLFALPFMAGIPNVPL